MPDDRETVVAIALAGDGEETQLSVRQGSCATEERLELHRSGWADSLERLEAQVIAG